MDKRFADFPALSKAIREMYRLFGRYPFAHPFGRNTIGGPGFCRKPLEQLSDEELSWSVHPGNAEDFKHFLPRLCEAVATLLIRPLTESHPYWIPLWDVCVALRNNQWRTWPQREQAAVQEFFVTFFNASLGIYPGERPEEHVRDMGGTGVAVSTLLQSWADAKGLSAALHLADFIFSQQENLFRLGGVRLGSATATALDEQVTAWLGQPQRKAFLEEMFFQHPDGRNAEDVSNAIRTYDLWKEAVANKA